MPDTCPECGAEFREGLTCQSVFEQFLALEFTDPGYGEVHLLTVACFMIQHERYSHEGLSWIEQRLRDHLEGGMPVSLIRQGAAKDVNQEQRDWKVTRRPGDPPQAKIAWSMTILDVALNYQDAESYREWVKKWARLTLQEMKPLLKKI